MRNYVMFLVIRMQSHWDDGMGAVADFDFYIAAGDDDDLETQKSKFNKLMADAVPPGYSMTSQTISEPLKSYVLLDKSTLLNLVQIFQAGIVFGMPLAFLLYQNQAVPLPPAVQTFRSQSETTPRYTGWKDQQGVTRKPPPSDKRGTADRSGVPAIIDFINNLPAYADVLRSEGRVREANIVMFAYNNVVSGIWSVTTALAYLRQNNL